MSGWNLLPNEKIIHQIKISRKIFLKSYFISFILLILAIYTAFFLKISLPLSPKIIGIIVFLIALVPTIFAELRCGGRVILITTDRILVKKYGEKGKGSTNIEAFPLESILNLTVNKTLKQRILGIGDLVFKLSMEEHVIKDIDNPEKIEQAIYKIIERTKELEEKSKV